MNFFSVVILTSLLLGYSLADIPVHCLKHEAVGEWTFSIDELKSPSKIRDSSCGHQLPDDPKTSYLAMKGEFKPQQSFIVNLLDSDIATFANDDKTIGKWTLIYDEGFEAQIGPHRFTSFFDYHKKGDYIVSYCGGTVVGWYLNTATNQRACFKAEKNVDDETKEALTTKSIYQIAIDDENTVIYTLQSSSETKMERATKTFVSRDSKNLEKIVAKINEYADGWVADIPKIFEDKSMGEINALVGRKKFRDSSKEELKLQENNDRIIPKDVSDLPKEFSWEGQMPYPRSQGRCGSCFAFAALGMIEARLQIKSDEKVVLSPQHVVDCSFQNQGCNGGYAFLVGKFGNEFELVPESCAPYWAIQELCEACDPSSLPKTYKVADYGFVGGAYGRCNEREMMLEIMNNGPIAASFEPDFDFHFYKGGVYKSVAGRWMENGEPKPEWERVTHSVICYGWGETEDHEKYWLVQNSWGSNWGNQGRFKIRRGVNEAGFESIAEFAIPYVVTK